MQTSRNFEMLLMRKNVDHNDNANLDKINSGSKLSHPDFRLYQTLSKFDTVDLGIFLHGIIIVTGNYQHKESSMHLFAMYGHIISTLIE